MLLLGIRIVYPIQEITIQLTAFLSESSLHQQKMIVVILKMEKYIINAR